MTPRWAVPDVGFSPAQLAAAEKIVTADLGGTARIGLAFLGGSYAVGLGHGTSDVDLYAVGDGLPIHAEMFERDGVCLHVGTLNADFVHNLISLGSAYVTTGFDRDQIQVDQRTLHGLVRIVTGVRVLETPKWTDELRSLRRDVLRQILVARNSSIFAAHAEDVYGALASGDPYTAVAASAIALESAAEATLAAADDIYLGPKFLFRRLIRNPVTADWSPLLWRLLNSAAPIFSGSAADLAAARTLAEQRLLAGNLLLSWCATEGWDQVLARLPIPPSNPFEAARSPYFTPIRFADGWAFTGPDNGYEVTEQVIRNWRDLPAAGLTPADPTGRALAAIGALRGTTPPAADPDLPADSGILPAGRFACHPKAEPARREAAA